MSISNTLSFTLYAFLLSPPCDPISDLLLNKRMVIWSLFVNIISNLQIKIESLLHKIKIIPRVTFNRCWSILYHSSSKFVHSSLLDGTCHMYITSCPQFPSPVHNNNPASRSLRTLNSRTRPFNIPKNLLGTFYKPKRYLMNFELIPILASFSIMRL